MLDATNPLATAYLWVLPDGKTSASTTLETRQPGTYRVSLFDKANCEFKSTVTVKQIQPAGKIRFAATSAAPINEPIVVLNLSDPAPLTIDWMIPNEAKITEKTTDRLQFSMATLGDYTIGIKATFAECELYQTKPVSIVDFFPIRVEYLPEPDQTILSVSPNPVSSEAEVKLRFDKPTSFSMKLYDSSHPDRVIFETTEKEQTDYNSTINALNLNAGTYILSVETPTSRFTKRVIIAR